MTNIIALSENATTSNYDEAIKQHYDQVALTDKDSSSSTMADIYISERTKQNLSKIK